MSPAELWALVVEERRLISVCVCECERSGSISLMFQAFQGIFLVRKL